jgi:uncharacterized membrane protein
MLDLSLAIIFNSPSMPNPTGNPIHKLGITRLWKESSILLSLTLLLLSSLIQLLLLLLLSPPLLLLSSLPLRTVIQQESQRTTKCQYDQRLENVRVYVVAVVAIAIVVVTGGVRVIVVIGLVFVPAGELGFEEGA